MFLHQSKNFILFVLIQLIFLLKLSLIICFELGDDNNIYDYKAIYINKKIIYIGDDENDFVIYEETRNHIGSYSDIIEKKDIIKIDEDNFLITGFGSDGNFKCIKMNFQNLNNNNPIDIKIEGIKSSNIEKYNFICTSLEICFITFIDNSNKKLVIYKIKLDSGTSDGNVVIQESNIDPINHFQCDFSSNEENYFCVANWGSSKFENKCYYGSIKDQAPFYVAFFGGDSSFSGNIKKINDNKYLVCFEETISEPYIKCQFYNIGSDGVTPEVPVEVRHLSSLNGMYEKPLIINIYKSSIFITNDYKLNNNLGYASYLIMTSINLKISVKKGLYTYGSLINSFQIFNDDENYYHFYRKGETKPEISKYGILDYCSENLIKLKKEETEVQMKLFNRQEGKKIYFYLNEFKIYKDDKDSLDFNNNHLEDITSGNYTLIKNKENGIFNSYYCIVNGANDDAISSFSLICPLKLVICYKDCEDCNEDFSSTSSNQYCTECDLENYFPIQSEKVNSPKGFNCYSVTDEKISNFYLENKAFYPCHYSCKTCINSGSCNFCRDGYYFKAKEDNTILFDEKCSDSIPDSYYLDFNANIPSQNSVIKAVYKPCYETCKFCLSSGTYMSNSCTSCSGSYKSYAFNQQQCTIDYSDCLKNGQYWKLEDFNIKCVEECDKSFVISGPNKGQCVESCDSYINPFSLEQTGKLLSYECNDISYCIPFNDCYRGSFFISDDGMRCERKKKCINIDIFDENFDPFEEEDDEEPPSDYEAKIEDIDKRLKIIKMFVDENKKDSKVLNDFFDLNIIKDYNDILFKEISADMVNNKYLITSTIYNNFTITIYPLDIEDFVYNKFIASNNLAFANFTKMYPDFINYELQTNSLILICLLERHYENKSINELNYYLVSFNEKKIGNTRYKGSKIILNETKEFLLNESSQLETIYPLYNYINITSSMENKRNTENLVDNIKDFNSKYPEVELYNLSDPFYNDICFLFTSDVGTDMTLNDRRNEYYVNNSLCEKNCTLMKIIDRDSEPKSVCNCNIKYNVSYNDQFGLKDYIIPYSVLNSKSFICISETFNFNLKKNGNFWIFILILIFQMYLLIVYIKHRESIMNKMLGLNNNNEAIENNSEESDFSYEYKKNIFGKNKNNSSNDKIESQQEEILSAPVNVSNPPRKTHDSKIPSNTTKTDIKIEEKDLISGNDSTLIKGSSIKLNDKNQHEFTDISFDDLQEGYEHLKIDNLLEQKGMMLKDNYLKNPLMEERRKKMKKIKKSLRPLNQNDIFKYNETCEDILYSNQNKDRFNKGKNKKVTKILDGKDIFQNYLIEYYSDNEDKPRYPKTKIKNDPDFKEEGLIGDEMIFTGVKANQLFLVEEGYNKNKIRITTNNNVDDLFGTGMNINNNTKNTYKYTYKNNNSLAKSLGKKDIDKLKEEEEKNERLKTEIEMNMSNKIKTELQKISKEGKRPFSSVNNMVRNRKKKDNDSVASDINILVKSNNVEPLKLKNNKINNKNNPYNKENLKEFDSKRKMGEGEIGSDMARENPEEEYWRRKRSRNLELLKERNFFTSMTETLEPNDREILIQENIFLYYWKYFMKREIWLLTIINKNDNIPYIIRYSSLAFCISFIFLLNCFFFFQSDVHRRYMNALSGHKNNIGFYFRKEFPTTLCVSLLGNLFKMIIIKLVIYNIFKISKNSKRMMKSSAEKGLTPEEIEQLKRIREKYLSNYKRNLLIYFICIMILNVFIAYICICYAGVFLNSQGAFLFGLLFSLIFSFIFCAIFCLIIVCLYKIGKRLDSKCAISAYIVLSILY